MKNKISAKIVADSKDSRGNRITTFLLTYPRFIHAEVMTHRMFSRNAASSRAIPFKTMVKSVEDDPFIPIAWQKDHKGMQGIEYITDSIELKMCKEVWLDAKNHAIKEAQILHGDLYVFGDTENPYKPLEMGITKQLCNRLLEPFLWYTNLVTVTEIEGFYELRCPKYQYQNGKIFRSWNDLVEDATKSGGSRDWVDGLKNSSLIEKLKCSQSGAEIHIQALAEAMWDAQNESTPKQLKSGEWHIPFGDRIQMTDQQRWDNSFGELIEADIKISTARCARLSYMTFDGEIDYEKDIQLHDTLLKSMHMSPFEHCSRCMSENEYSEFVKGRCYREPENTDYIEIPKETEGYCNNFRGFIPYRYLIEYEK